MSPHSLPPDFMSPLNGHSSRCVATNGINGFHATGGKRSDLEQTPKDELHDLVCIGFGPASLAIAISLKDALDGTDRSLDLKGPKSRSPRVAFLEKQDHFAWHSGMLIEGARMQITFIKDMATLRNPRSRFTFLNYLHEQDRLVEFTNLDTFLPQRIEFEHYLKWCASFFDDVVDYSEEVLDVRAHSWNERSENPVDSWMVTSQNTRTGEVSHRRTRNVVVAAGGRPYYPTLFRKRPYVIHSSRYLHEIPKLLPDRNAQYKIAVIGSGQSAGEVFHDLHSRYPQSSTRLIIKGAALRPSDDSPFVNEIFNPSHIDQFYSGTECWRQEANKHNRCTNYGVVRLNLLEHIYETLYMQRITHGNNETTWPHKIITNATVTDLSIPSSGFKARLNIRRSERGLEPASSNGEGRCMAAKSQHGEEQDFDAVILGTGYERNAYERLLSSLHPLRPGWSEAQPNVWKVKRDYSVEFAEGKVKPGCGIWLQGYCEDSHGLADTLLSVLAVRGGEIVRSIFGQTASTNGANGDTQVGGVNKTV